MSDALNEAAAIIAESIRETKDFTVEHAPDVVQQMLTWNLTLCIIWAAAGLLIIAIVAHPWAQRSANDKRKHAIDAYEAGEPWTTMSGGRETSYQYDKMVEPARVIFGIRLTVGLIGTATLLVSAAYMLKILLAPKWYIVEKLMNAVGAGG